MSDITIQVGVVDRASRQLNNINKATNSLAKTLNRAQAAAAAFASSAILRGVVSQYTAFEKYRTVLTTFAGSQSKANRQLEHLQKLANALPQDLNDITNAFTRLTAFGIDNSAESLTAFSNIAAANGKSMSQLAEAVGDALTGEFERLKEFNIKVSKENDKFVARMGEQQVAISSSTTDLVNKLKELGEEGGVFSGAAAANANTLNQSLSNLTGALNEMAIAFGQGSKTGFKTFADTMAELLRLNKDFFTTLGEVAGMLATGLATAISFVVENMDLLKTAFMAFLALKAGAAIQALSGNFVKLATNIRLTGIASQKAARLMKTNLLGIALALGVALAEATGKLDDLFTTLGMGGDTDPFGPVAKSLTDVLSKLDGLEAGSAAFQTAAQNANLLDTTIRANAAALGVYVKQKEQLLAQTKEQYEADLKAGKVNVKALETINQLNDEIAEGTAILKDYNAAKEAAEGPLKIEITPNWTDAELAAKKLIDATREKIKQDKLDVEVLAVLKNSYEQGYLTIQEYTMAKEQLLGVQKKELTASQSIAKNLERQKKAYDDITATLKDQKKIADMAKEIGVSTEQMTRALNEERDNYTDFMSQAELTSRTFKEKMMEAGEALSRSLAESIVTGKNAMGSFKDFVKQTLIQILQQIINSGIQRALASLFNIGGGAGQVAGGIGGLLGGGSILGLGMSTFLPGFGLLAGIGGILGGLFADGGNTARAGQKPILVGERGPEVFLPGRAGTVIANEELNAMNGQGDLNVNFTINAIDTQSGVEFLIENKRVITGVIQEAYQRRGTSGPLG